MKLPVLKPVFRMVMRIVSWVFFLLTVIAAYGGQINPKYFSLPSVFTLMLPYFTIATAALTVFWACYGRLFSTSLGVITILVCLNPLSVAFPINFGEKADPEEETFTLTTYNILHFNDCRKNDYAGNRAAEFLLKTRSDIVCMQEIFNIDDPQETGMPKSILDSLKTLYPYRAGDKGNDLKVFSKYPVSLQHNYPYKRGMHIPFDFYTVEIKGRRLNIANVHLASYLLSSDERSLVTGIRSVEAARRSIDEFKGTVLDKLGKSFRTRAQDATRLRELLDRLPDPVIVCGDFNDVPASWAYRTIKGDDFKDAYAETSFGHVITFNKHMFFFHIDQILYRGRLKALSVEKGKNNSSDHYPLTATFAFTQQ